ncbi:MAG TPA: hypothetical protein VJ044_10705 [Candidatus Hodarchaeales archaeon]|nr:hypothetical protein [Candidatus Hodarchaeales archaeon]
MSVLFPAFFKNVGLVYSEFDQHNAPSVRCAYPNYDERFLKNIVMRLFPYGRSEEGTELFLTYQINQEYIAISYLRRFRGVRTAAGSSAAAITWVSDYIFNVFVIKPFLEKLLNALVPVAVTQDILKALLKAIQDNLGQVREDIKAGTSNVWLASRIYEENELPELIREVNANLR